METILVQIKNSKAYSLLEGLEDLQLIKVLKKSDLPKRKLSKKYAGKIPSTVADEIQNSICESREQWNKRSI